MGVLIRRNVEKSELLKLYGRAFGRHTLHHLIPTTRGGEFNQFNIYPMSRRQHTAWHMLFDNLTIQEVWDEIDVALNIIFGAGRRESMIEKVWTHSLGKLYEGNNGPATRTSRVKLTARWIECFGNDDLAYVKGKIQYMMLYMIFGGANIVNSDNIFENGAIGVFIKNFPEGFNEQGVWAFNTCFGVDATIAHIKAATSGLIKQYKRKGIQ